jgi:hypothetical protein
LPVPVGNKLGFPLVDDSNLLISEATPVDGKFVVAAVAVVEIGSLGAIGVGVPVVDAGVGLVTGCLVVAADAKALTAALLVDVVLFVGVIPFFPVRPAGGAPPETGGFPGGFDASTSTQMPVPTSDVKAIIRERFI